MKKINTYLSLIGINVMALKLSLVNFLWFIRQYFAFRKELKRLSPHIKIKLYPCLQDRGSQSGIADGHYFHQDLYVASKIFCENPKNHLDIASRIDGFVAHVASFRKLDVIDIRPLKSSHENINFIQADIYADESIALLGTYQSISCLHALEHMGLGRYGDKLNVYGHVLAFKKITELLESGGVLYLSLPIGEPRIEFNAHRIFSLNEIMILIKYDYELIDFSYVNDLGVLYKNYRLSEIDYINNLNCNYGLGILVLRKR